MKIATSQRRNLSTKLLDTDIYMMANAAIYKKNAGFQSENDSFINVEYGKASTSV